MVRPSEIWCKADTDEGLMVIYNEIFLGLIRERAEIAPWPFDAVRCAICCGKPVVTACTALETYLPILLRDRAARGDSGEGAGFCAK